MTKYKYEIIFYDGYHQRYFEFYAFNKDQAYQILDDLLAKDGFKKNNQSCMLTFKELWTIAVINFIANITQ